MSEVKRTIRVTTEQRILKDRPPVDNFPIREWSVEITMLDQSGNEIPANILDRVTYTLHPTFVNPVRTIRQQPFRVQEQGWGGFDIPIAVHLNGISGKLGERKLNHDLNFAQEKYTVDHTLSIPTNKSPVLNKLLLESGAVPNNGEDFGAKRKTESDLSNKAKKSKTTNGSAVKGSIDLEKLANGLTKLNEEDLVGIVQMVTDNRTNEMNIKNDVDNGEFTMDLYTLPDSLLKSLWDYVKKRTEEA